MYYVIKRRVKKRLPEREELVGQAMGVLEARLKEMGDNTAYEQVMQAVSDFEKGNMRLSTVLAALGPVQQ